MKLYHGSKQKINEPKYNGSKADNDYGAAFYLTKDLESAHEWACRNNSVGFVNEYQLNTENLKILDLTDKTKYSVLNWVAILLHFRSLEPSFIKSFKARLLFLEERYYIDVTQYDLVIGYRADDAYFRFPLDFIRGNLTLAQLEYSFNLGQLGVQYVIKSQKGINHLKYIKTIDSERKYINQYYESIKSATIRFDELDKDDDGIRIFDLMRNAKWYFSLMTI